jgi:hypothetical protein
MTPPTFQELLTSQEARFTNEQLEALLNEATPGPWVAKGRYIGTPSHMSYVAEVRDQNGNWSDTAKSRRDAALIAAAPALAAALLAERKAREVEVGELKRTMFTVRVIAVDALFQPTFQRTALERISAELRAALEGPTP